MSDSSNQFHDVPLDRRTILKALSGATAATAAIGSLPMVSAAAGSYTNEDYNGRPYTKYVPTSYDGGKSVPILMMLHGCTQDPDGFKNGTQMNQVAENNEFIVVYPKETSGIEKCWKWFNDKNTTRGNGEVVELVGIINQEENRENIDKDRVYVAGLSAGAFMVPNLLVEYADVFAAGGICSGGMYDVAESRSQGNQVISSQDCSAGTYSDLQKEGKHAYNRMVKFGIDDHNVPTIIFHGTDDHTVTTCNAFQAAEQATQTNDLLDDDTDNGSVDYNADQTNTGSGPSLSYTEYVYEDSNGDPIVDHYVVKGMGHAWSGGSQSGSYTAPGGPDASNIIWDYFTQWDNSSNSLPNADIQTSKTSAQPGVTINFDGSGSSDPDGSISNYMWKFGDGSTATGTRVSHSYSSTGDYNVTLTVTDSKGATGTNTVSISVTDGTNANPTASINASSTTVNTGSAVNFDGSGSSDPDGSISNYMWKFGDGSTATGTRVSHSYSSTGDYNVTLTVTDDGGVTDTASITITVNSFSGYCGTADNYTHVQKGRAYAPGDGYAYAKGSDEKMGLNNTYYTTTLKETSKGYYKIVSSC